MKQDLKIMSAFEELKRYNLMSYQKIRKLNQDRLRELSKQITPKERAEILWLTRCQCEEKCKHAEKLGIITKQKILNEVLEMEKLQ